MVPIRRQLFLSIIADHFVPSKLHLDDNAVTDPTTMSAPDPREAWARIQNELTRRSARFGGGGGGPPRGTIGGIGTLIVLSGGLWAANQSLFNGS